ncbi:glutathione S-transferase family protein, partial [Photobacterium sp. OFAV2-7]|uniref:glutathione S-transferase family protein n=1 Tax=Photobacterium sp. OFAV2-7 TaxID=2917748 RepID=UPI001EF5239D
IFHHKSVSPYSEKIRLMLGYTNLSWLSVEAPLTPPRPSIDPLLDGYRRIPVVQLGADIFCDTRIIAAEISELSGNEKLNPFFQSQEEWQWSEYIENDVFHFSLNSLHPLGLIRALLSQVPLRQLPNYLADKKHLFRNSNPELTAAAPDRARSKALWQRYLDKLETRLLQDFLNGSAPTYADFCAVHLIWFRMGMEGRVLFKGRPQLEKWYQKMISFSHGRSADITPFNAITSAKNNQPRLIDTSMTQGSLIGKRVSVSTTDILLGDTQGCLVGEDNERWILARDTEVAGRVHVHFPKATYQITTL